MSSQSLGWHQNLWGNQAALNQDVTRLDNDVAGTILQAGFGCRYTDVPGSTIPLAEALDRGDVDIAMEIRLETAPAVSLVAVAAG